VVLALPRGGVSVGFEIAKALGAPLDVVLVRKIGAPFQPELALGAVVDGDRPETVLNEEIVRALGVPESYLAKARARQLEEIERRRARYFAGRTRVPVEGRTAIVVDDGIATGATMEAALHARRRARPRRLVLATPVAPPDTIERLRPEADEVVCLAMRRGRRAPAPGLAARGGGVLTRWQMTALPLGGSAVEAGEAFRLAPAHHAPAGERPAGLGDHRALPLPARVLVEVEHHPVAGAAEFVGAGGVGEQGREAPVAALAVEDGQPGLACGVEPPRRDPGQGVAVGLLAVLAVDVEEQVDPGLDGAGRAGACRAQAGEHGGKGGAQHGGAARADALDPLEAAVVGGELEGLEGTGARAGRSARCAPSGRSRRRATARCRAAPRGPRGPPARGAPPRPPRARPRYRRRADRRRPGTGSPAAARADPRPRAGAGRSPD
jgi:putative phosphoribosyl transferase